MQILRDLANLQIQIRDLDGFEVLSYYENYLALLYSTLHTHTWARSDPPGGDL